MALKLSKKEREAVQRKLDSWGIKARVDQHGSVIDKAGNQVGHIRSVVWNLNRHYMGGIIREINFIHYRIGKEKE